ncbi:MAG: 6-carboxytetrahydropterin synthase QueD [Phycisphaerales bacterium]|nr:6-carboxytetrahydropterin synthase QueD [Phycisphaerales bacterium]
MEIYKEFKFEAAHRLIGVPADHPCARIHGHSYRLVVYVRGRPDERVGWVQDFGEIKRVCQPLVDRLDHQYLNEIEGLEQSTAERIAQWFWRGIRPSLPGLDRIELKETATSGVVYRGEDE